MNDPRAQMNAEAKVIPKEGESSINSDMPNVQLNERQALALYNSWMKGLSYEMVSMMCLPEALDHRISRPQDNQNLMETRRRRYVCQFLRDMADAFDPDGTWISRHKPDVGYYELLELCSREGLSLSEGVRLLQLSLHPEEELINPEAGK